MSQSSNVENEGISVMHRAPNSGNRILTISKRTANMFDVQSYIEKIRTIEKKQKNDRITIQRLERNLRVNEEEINDLVEENSRLRLKLFWQLHNTTKLTELMRDLNMMMSPPCDCKICIETGRNPNAEATSSGSEASEPCVFSGAFNTLLAKHGIKYHHHIVKADTPRHLREPIVHSSYGKYFPLYFGIANVISYGPDKYWRNVAYGFDITDITDPDKEEGVKLRTLFDVVNLSKSRAA